jgi:SAM-dependent methyltransferase
LQSGSPSTFGGSISGTYQKYLVPLIFEPYAADIVRRLSGRRVHRLLEIAAGTGAVTRAMAAALPPSTAIVATDLNQAMLDEAGAAGTPRPVEWRQADALKLPFEDGTFDAVVCQFGAMFFPDRAKGFSEARRVLKPGGVYIFSVWDRIEENPFADLAAKSVAAMFPADPPSFLSRVPYGYSDVAVIRRDLTSAGVGDAEIATVTASSRAPSPRHPAIGFVQGTPLRGEIESRDASALNAATEAAVEAIAARFGSGEVEAPIQAHVVTIS